MPEPPSTLTPLVFMGSSQRDLRGFPDEARREVGLALYAAQQGKKHASAKPLTGDKAFRGASVLEIVEDEDGNTYRAVYTVQFAGVIYVLHAFQKKSTRGIATPQRDLETIKQRLKDARERAAQSKRETA